MADIENYFGFRFLVVGLVRNCEKTLSADLDRFRQALTRAAGLAFLLIESDSDDDTISILRKTSQDHPNFAYISLGDQRYRYPLRTERISICRNRYLEEIRLNPKYRNYDYVIVADFDGVNTKLTEQSIMSCFKRGNWDACCANQTGPYYDIWALRHKDWSPNDCWSQQKFLESHGMGRFRAVLAAVYSRMLVISRDSEWIEVDSAFGGCSIYEREVLMHVSYSGLTHSGSQVCEHVEFNRQIRENGGRVFINPEFINASFVEHSRNSYGFGLVVFWLKSCIRGLGSLIRVGR